MQAPPIDAQPPQFSNLPKTSLTEALGAKTQSGMMMTKKPMRNIMRMRPSKRGRCLAAKALKEIAKAPTAMVMSVPCLLLLAHRAVKVREDGGLPDCGNIGWVVHRSQNEDNITGLIGGRRDECLPTQSGQPTGNVAEDLLHIGRSKL